MKNLNFITIVTYATVFSAVCTVWVWLAAQYGYVPGWVSVAYTVFLLMISCSWVGVFTLTGLERLLPRHRE